MGFLAFLNHSVEILASSTGVFIKWDNNKGYILLSICVCIGIFHIIVELSYYGNIKCF